MSELLKNGFIGNRTMFSREWTKEELIIRNKETRAEWERLEKTYIRTVLFEKDVTFKTLIRMNYSSKEKANEVIKEEVKRRIKLMKQEWKK